jgi:hypothetical protein
MAFNTKIGNNNARSIMTGLDFDPETGWVWRETWEGSEDAIKAVQIQYAAAGYRSRSYQQEGPVWRGDFTRAPSPEEGGQAEVTDQWEFDTEFVQQSIYESPNVIAAAGNDDESLSIAKSAIEQAISDRLSLSEFQTKFPTATPLAIQLFVLRTRGQQAVEVERLVVRRVRTLTISTAQRVTLDAVPRIYSTAALINTFGLPQFIADRLPAIPGAAPNYTAWAWKKRRDTSTFIAQLNKFQEIRDWVFAAWSTLTYQLIDV